MRSSSTSSPERLNELSSPVTHKRRLIWRRSMLMLQLRCNPLSGGGGNRTRVRGRTGQNVYKRSPRFSFDRRPEADALPTV